jgi:hypothetical protein
MEAVAANVTTIRSTTANLTTANVTIGYITTANIATANVAAMESVSANVTTIRSTTANLTTANVTTLLGTVDGTNPAGYLNIPINSQIVAYTTVASDSGKAIFHPSTDANARTFTIAANGSVPYALGTAITFINMTTQVVSIAITTDTMYLSSAGTTGTRSLALYGSATAIKMTSTTWLISGSGLT